MKKLIILLILLLGCRAYAFDIVYPKKNNVTINAKSTFFIGSSDKPLKINGNDVPLHSSGGFAYVVDLGYGENTFLIESEYDMQRYVITRPIIKPAKFNSEFQKFDSVKYFYTVHDNSPMRTTPIDAGINRASHLQKGILVKVDGEKDGFYRVNTNSPKYFWIAKTDVKEAETTDLKPAIILGEDFIETDDCYEFIYHLSKPVPFEISQDNPLTLKLYNLKGDDVYIKEFPFLRSLSGYDGKYTGNDFIFKIRKQPKINPKKPLRNIVIVADAGHGGKEYGAIGCLGDKEKDINLEIANYLKDYLKQSGAKVIMTRTEDSYLGLQERVDIANDNNANVFISIHANAVPDGTDPNKKSGVGVYYYYNQAQNLAQTILDTMASELELNNNKIHQESFAVVRNTNVPSILIETAYLINPDDNSKLITPEFQKQCAKAIADGLEIYFSNLNEGF